MNVQFGARTAAHEARADCPDSCALNNQVACVTKPRKVVCTHVDLWLLYLLSCLIAYVPTKKCAGLLFAELLKLKEFLRGQVIRQTLFAATPAKLSIQLSFLSGHCSCCHLLHSIQCQCLKLHRWRRTVGSTSQVSQIPVCTCNGQMDATSR